MCITSAIPDMPMPPMPMKWIVPMSVPTPFMARRRSGIGAVRDRGQDHFLGGGRVVAEDAAGPLDQVGEVARRVRSPDRARARSGIGERFRRQPQFLHLLGEL